MFTSRISIFASLAIFVILGNELDAKTAFVVTAYYNILRTSMTMLFPQGVYQLAETLVSVRRIQKFMLYDELPRSKEQLSRAAKVSSVYTDPMVIREDDEFEPKKPVSAYINTNRNVVKVEDIYAKWDHNATEYTLNNLNLTLKPGMLVAVIGPVGAGKSSLMQAILGELPLESGHISVDGKVSYASQEPWLFSASIRQNILFGLPMDRERYRKVVKVCALERDFTLFPQRDKTVVGERGASLSGGQKARINLARAVYRRADIYLLDDPLSAVDSHVGRHLFDQCVKSYLQGSVTLLITHQIQYLQEADQIILMDHGKISAIGTYDHLSRSGLDFTKLLSEPDKSEEKEEKLELEEQRRVSKLSTKSGPRPSILSILTMDENTLVQDEKRDTGKIAFAVSFKYLSLF